MEVPIIHLALGHQYMYSAGLTARSAAMYSGSGNKQSHLHRSFVSDLPVAPASELDAVEPDAPAVKPEGSTAAVLAPELLL